jgi:hypothetical protein
VTSIDSFPEADGPAGYARCIPSRFPPVQTFDAVTTGDDLEAVMELEGWTNDRLVADRLARLPRDEWVYGIPNSSVIMAAFLHGSPTGLRFTSQWLGAWYAADETETGVIEVANGLRNQIAAAGMDEITQEYRVYTADLGGRFVDVRGAAPDLHDPADYGASQDFGEAVRASDRDGILYESVRRAGHACVVAYRPSQISAPVQGEHLRLTVPISGKVIGQRLGA